VRAHARVLSAPRTDAGMRYRKAKEGEYWAHEWTTAMGRCDGFASKDKKHALPCMPATIVYGHTASFGLDVRRWSIGLDTGCVRACVRGDVRWRADEVTIGVRPPAERARRRPAFT
jgi:hypothetical protein